MRAVWQHVMYRSVWGWELHFQGLTFSRRPLGRYHMLLPVIQGSKGSGNLPHPSSTHLSATLFPNPLPHTHTHQGKAHEGYLIQISPTLLTHHSCGCKSLCQTSTIWRHITEREPRTAQRSWQGQRKNEGITERIRSRRHGLELEQTEKTKKKQDG